MFIYNICCDLKAEVINNQLIKYTYIELDYWLLSNQTLSMKFNILTTIPLYNDSPFSPYLAVIKLSIFKHLFLYVELYLKKLKEWSSQTCNFHFIKLPNETRYSICLWASKGLFFLLLSSVFLCCIHLLYML